MSLQRVALIFDDKVRPDTTGVYCRRALQGLVEVTHFTPDQLDAVPRQGFDLYLNIDDGLEYRLPGELRPCAWWAIDTHLNFDWCLTRARGFDFVFAAQRDGAEGLREHGIDSAAWLPLASDPQIHRQHEVVKEFDVCFIGHIFPGPRASLVDLLRRRFRNTFVGQRYFEDMARTYSASRMVFNRSIRNDVNMRVFEALACGSLLVTNDLRDNGQEELFRDGVHLATYRDAEELLDKVRFYLKREEVRELLAAAGRAAALEQHTYRHRMERVLAEVGKALASRSHAVRGNALPATQNIAVAAPLLTELPGSALQATVCVAAAIPTEAVALPPNTGPDAFGAARIHAEERNGVPAPVRDRSRFEHVRPEILALIPQSARKVLDIGCAAGRLGEALKARQTVEVAGIECDAEAAERARTRLDQVLLGDVEELRPDFAPRSFDAVVCGDVLECLRRPDRLLRRARRWLRPGGRLIASIHNVRHHSVLTGLLDGNWTYQAAGPLDHGHVRFFTRRAIHELFEHAGYGIRKTQIVPGPGYAEWQARGRPGEVRAGRLHIAGMAVEDAEEFYVYQWLVVATPTPLKGQVPGKATSKTRSLSVPAQSRTGKPSVPASSPSVLRILYLGNFSHPWTTETAVADALVRAGHAVTRLEERAQPSAHAVCAELTKGHYDCLLFAKGRIGARSESAMRGPSGDEICEVLESTRVPAYMWYFDRVHEYQQEPWREQWMGKVAPLCRVVFTTDGALAQTGWARWHVLRQGIDPATVRPCRVREEDRSDVGFLGQVYGHRAGELELVLKEFTVNHIQGAYGPALSEVIHSHKVILGPRYPSVPGYWSNRLYVVLGHGGFFLAPEVEGMRDDGFMPGVHYVPLSDDPVKDLRYWLARPREREQIAQAGQELVLRSHTYQQRVAELCSAMATTL